MSLNRIIVQGRLGSDVELRTTPNGVKFATVVLAVDRDRKDQSGDTQTDWITITAWRQTGEFVSKYFTKGRMAIVEGRLQIRDWTDKDGNKRKNAEIVANNVYFGDSKRDTDKAQDIQNSSLPEPEFAPLGDDDAELPF